MADDKDNEEHKNDDASEDFVDHERDKKEEEQGAQGDEPNDMATTKSNEAEEGKEENEENDKEKEQQEKGPLAVVEWIDSVKLRQEQLATAEEARCKEWTTQWTALQAHAQVYSEIAHTSLDEMKQLDTFFSGIRTAQDRFNAIVQERVRLLLTKSAAAEISANAAAQACMANTTTNTNNALDSPRTPTSSSTDHPPVTQAISATMSPIKSTMDTQDMPWTEIIELKQQHEQLWAKQHQEQQQQTHQSPNLTQSTPMASSPFHATTETTPPPPLSGTIATTASTTTNAPYTSAFTPLLEALQLSQGVWESKFSSQTHHMRSATKDWHVWKDRMQYQLDQLHRLQTQVYPALQREQAAVQSAWEKYAAAVQTLIHSKRKRSTSSLRSMMGFSRAATTTAAAATKVLSDPDQEWETELARSHATVEDVWMAESNYLRAVQLWREHWDMFCLGTVELKEELLLQPVDDQQQQEQKNNQDEKVGDENEKEGDQKIEEDKDTPPWSKKEDQTDIVPETAKEDTVASDDGNPQDAEPEKEESEETKEKSESDTAEESTDNGAFKKEETNTETAAVAITKTNESSSEDPKKDTDEEPGSPSQPPLIALRVLLKEMEETEAERRVDIARRIKDWVTGQEKLFVGAEAATKLAWLDWTTGEPDEDGERTAVDSTNKDSDVPVGNVKAAGTSSDEPSIKASNSGDDMDGKPSQDGDDETNGTPEKMPLPPVKPMTAEELRQRKLQIQKQVKQALTRKWGSAMASDWLQAISAPPDETLYMMEDVFGIDAYLDSPHVVSAAVGEWWRVKRPTTGTAAESSNENNRENDRYQEDDDDDEDEPERHLALVIISSGPQMHLFNLPTNQVVLDLETPPHDALYELLTASSSSSSSAASSSPAGIRSRRFHIFPPPSLSLPMADSQVNLTEEMDTMEIIPSASATASLDVPCIRLLCPHMNNIY